MSNFNAIGMFIFCGSATFGTERAGFKVDKILEMDDAILELNAYHFDKNRPDIPVVLPKEWENEDYLEKAKNANFDLLYSNCPCSGLSQINRNASADSDTNAHFFRVFEGIKSLQPKAFLIENAPTLAKMGYPLLLKMFNEIGDNYKFTIVRDYAGNHGVGMRRMRTLVVGWRKDVFKNQIPLLHMNKQEQKTVKDIIGDLYNAPLGSLPNHELHDDRGWKDFDDLLIPYVEDNSSMLLAAIEHFDKFKDELAENKSVYNQILKTKTRIEENKNIWDKTPWRTAEDKPAPSLTSVSSFVHPVHNRQWTIREYARLMGFPDNFELVLDGGCKTDVIQCLAQGVPADFIEYIASEIYEALNGNREFVVGSEGKTASFQHHTHEKFKAFTKEELIELGEPDENGKIKGLDSDNTFEKLEK